MPRKISLVFRDRQGSAPALMLFLLAMAGAAGDSTLVATLRGNPVENEERATPALGYYEGLINAPRREVVGEVPQPPPGWLPFGGEVTGIVQELPTYLRWEMKPNLDIRWNGTTFRTNSLGFRTPEVTLEKPAGTYRIVVFGSSNTMGYGVNGEDQYTRHLQHWLNEWAGALRRVEVVNLAVAGDSPTRRLARLRKEAGRWNADWVVCDATALDSWLEDVHIHSVVQRGLPIPFPFVSKAISRSGVTPADSFEVFREKFRGESEGLLGDVYAAWCEGIHAPASPLDCAHTPPVGQQCEVSPRFRADSLARQPAWARFCGPVDLIGSYGSRGIPHLRVGQAFQRPRPSGHLRGFSRRHLAPRGASRAIHVAPSPGARPAAERREHL